MKASFFMSHCNLTTKSLFGMKKFTRGGIFILVLLAGGLLLGSCKKGMNTGTKIQYKAQAVNPSYTITGANIVPTTMNGSSSAARTDGSISISWNAGYMIVSKIEFEAEKENSEKEGDTSAVNFEMRGPVKVDLFSTPSFLGTITIPPATYDQIEIKVEGKKTASGDPNFYLKGIYTDSSGKKIPLELQVNENFEIDAEQPKFVAQAIDYTSLIKLRLDLLAKNISATNLNSATQTNGTIIISSTSNTGIYQTIVSNFLQMGEVEFD